MTYAEYAAIDAVNWSTLKALRLSPLHYQHELRTERSAWQLRVGLALHAFLLDPDEFDRGFVQYKGQRRGNAWKEFQVEHEGKTILTETEWQKAIGAATAILAHDEAAQFLTGLKEQPVTWTDERTGLRCKGRVDVAGAHLVDVKSTGVIEPRRFSSHAARMGYHGQLAFYLDGLRANDVHVHDEPMLIAVESDKPHDVIPYRVPTHVVDAGRSLYHKLLDELKACRERGEWPGIAPEPIDLLLPDWIYHDEEPLEFTMGGEAMEL